MMSKPIFEAKFYKVIERPNRSITILSASNEGIEIGPGTEIGDLIDSYNESISIFAERITILEAEDLRKPSFGSNVAKTINLSTTQLIAPSASKSRISLAGQNGIINDGGHPSGQEATNGKYGGTLNVFVSQWSPSTSSVIFDVRGGNGETNNSLKLASGSGGKGGSVNAFMVSIWDTVYQRLIHLQKLCPPKGSQSQGGDIDDALASDDLRRQHLDDIVNLVKGMGTQIAHPYDEVLETLEPASMANGHSATTLRKAVSKCLFVIRDALRDQAADLKELAYVAGGHGGSATILKGDRGITGLDGESGTANCTLAKEYPAPTPNFIPVHPLQCQMQLEKIQAYLYFGDPQSLAMARESVISLVHKLAYVLMPDEPKRTTALRELYLKSRDALGISGPVDALSQLQNIYAAAQDVLFQLVYTSVDYYGLRQNWVPRTSTTSFKAETDVLSSRLKEAEDLRLSYGEAVQKRASSADDRKKALGQVESTMADSTEQLAELRDLLLQLRGKILSPDLRQAIIERGSELDFQIQQLEEEVRVNFSVGMQSLKAAAMSVAAEPTKVTVAKETAKLAWAGLTTIPNVEGVPVDKSLLMEQLEVVSGNLQDALKNYQQRPIMSETGELNSDTKNTKVLIADSEQIEKFCVDFAKEAVSHRAQKTRNVLREYVKLVSDRNSDIVQYNLVLNKILGLRNDIDSMGKQRTSVQSSMFKADDLGQLAQMADLVDDVYSQIRARTMRLVSFYRRAIYFSTLENPRPFGANGTNNDAALALGSVKLQEIQRSLNSQLFDLRAKKGSDAPRFPANYEKERGKLITLDKDQLTQLVSKRSVLISLTSGTRSKPTYPDFAGCADVRAYRVRFWLDGLTVINAASGDNEMNNSSDEDDIPVKMHLIHRGDSTFRDIHDQEHVFEHDEIHVSPSYRIPAKAEQGKEKKKFQIVDSGDIVNYTSKDTETNTAFAAPSPFATWIISLEHLDPRLNLDTVTRARFEFFGTCRSFV